MTDWKVMQSSREIIERKLLCALEDDLTVAILATKEDLDILIAGLRELSSMRAADRRTQTLIDGLGRLREASFGEVP